MSRTHYITHVSLGHWPITRPKRTVDKSLIAAQNQVCRELMKKMGVTPPSSGFRAWMFREYGWDLIDEAKEYIGVTTEIVIMDGQMPREFRREYCTPKLDDDSWSSLMGGEC